MKDFEIEKSKLVGVKFLWRIGKLYLSEVTFQKYGISRMISIMNENNETVVLSEMVGEETHKCVPDVILQLGGRVGDVIKEFKLEKRGKIDAKVVKIIEICN